ncbi:SAM-dependent methyltransferase [Saccharopolyspora erythraea]|uniref:class I SAM-dependent methyltransferase n=1 Tax=Saccharopolyspora erythraea TaxID=1836 RepID=UPI001BA7277A|nr:SAM-dependent methyltransferase [Saccharopolyspora erythraea]QUG99410.1 SAM-dependent methyltransferase [Saccharopolyspora erythraea]
MTLAGKVRAAKGATSPTAELCAVIRAAETQQPEQSRLLDDPFARYFLQNWRFRSTHPFPPVFRFCLRMADRRYTGLLAEVVLRHRFCDEVVDAEVAAGCTQVVVLGAGYDTTALRHDFGSDVVVYEVDKPDTQAEKMAIMRRNSLHPKARVQYVTCDFAAGDDLGERLTSQGFDPARRSVVIWMGVTYYLPGDSVLDTLGKLGAVTAPGSKVVLDYMDASVVGGSGDDSARRARQLVASGGEPFVFGVEADDIRAFCDAGGFGVAGHHRIPDLLRRYGDDDRFWLTVVDYMGVLLLEKENAPVA